MTNQSLFIVATLAALISPLGQVVFAEDLIINRVEVKTTKADGKAWDVGGDPVRRPDLKVKVERGGVDATTGVARDVYDADFRVKSLRIEPGDRIRITVYDDDAFVDDICGSRLIEITRGMLVTGKLELKFEQVEKLLLTFN